MVLSFLLLRKTAQCPYSKDAVEQYITASTAKQILDYLVTPSFKQGQWYNGIDRGTSAIMEAVQGNLNPRKAPEEKEVILLLSLFLFSSLSLLLLS